MNGILVNYPEAFPLVDNILCLYLFPSNFLQPIWMSWQTIGSQNKWRPKQIQENATRGEYETELDSAATWSQKSPIFHDISFLCQIYLLFHVKHIFWDVENRGKLLYVSIMYDQHMTARGRHTRCFSTGPHTNEPTRPALLKISLNISKCVKIPPKNSVAVRENFYQSFSLSSVAWL